MLLIGADVDECFLFRDDTFHTGPILQNIYASVKVSNLDSMYFYLKYEYIYIRHFSHQANIAKYLWECKSVKSLFTGNTSNDDQSANFQEKACI